MLAVRHHFTPFCSQRQKPHQLLGMEQGKLGEIINSGGLRERGKARLKRRTRQRKKNHLWRKKNLTALHSQAHHACLFSPPLQHYSSKSCVFKHLFSVCLEQHFPTGKGERIKCVKQHIHNCPQVNAPYINHQEQNSSFFPPIFYCLKTNEKKKPSTLNSVGVLLTSCKDCRGLSAPFALCVVRWLDGYRNVSCHLPLGKRGSGVLKHR